MKTKLLVLIFLFACLIPYLLFAQFIQQGPKLVSTGGSSGLGYSSAISSDGNTAVVGGPFGGSAGIVVVFTRSGGIWMQQAILAGTGAISFANIGLSVAVSSDGNTVVAGGPWDNYELGAVWVFTRSGSVWTQQGSKLVGTGTVGNTRQGFSVAISSDGNTALVGGPSDSSTGAVWTFIRTGGIWTQQGSKVVGTGGVGNTNQGCSVAFSSDGTTSIVGATYDSNGVGAVWVFTRNGGVWTQQGSKLIGSGTVGIAKFGNSVAISSDGNTAVIGGYGDNDLVGAIWVFTRTGGFWTQQGTKLVGTGAVGTAEQGISVAVSSDGNIILEGGDWDNNLAGAVWVFTRSAGVWTQQGPKLVGTGGISNVLQGISVAISSNGNTAIEGGYRDNNYTGAEWVFDNPTIGITPISIEIPGSFSISQNYPNPFNPTSKIKFAIQKTSITQLKVFDILGREVATLVNQLLQPGTYEVTFDRTTLPSGVYFYRLTAGDFVETKKMSFVK